MRGPSAYILMNISDMNSPRNMNSAKSAIEMVFISRVMTTNMLHSDGVSSAIIVCSLTIGNLDTISKNRTYTGTPLEMWAVRSVRRPRKRCSERQGLLRTNRTIASLLYVLSRSETSSRHARILYNCLGVLNEFSDNLYIEKDCTSISVQLPLPLTHWLRQIYFVYAPHN